MATTARFAAGGSSSPPTPAPATTPPAQTQATQLIVLPAGLHQVTHLILTLLYGIDGCRRIDFLLGYAYLFCCYLYLIY